MSKKIVIIICLTVLCTVAPLWSHPNVESNDLTSFKSLVAAAQKNLTIFSPPTPIELKPLEIENHDVTPCNCAIFLSGQFVKGSDEQPKGYPALIHELDINFPSTPVGMKKCTNKCLDSILKHLPNSAAILCGTMDRDCYKERAYLFIQDGAAKWKNTNLSAGREYCCKDNLPYKCPLV